MSASRGNRRQVLVVSQTFVPDPAAVGQHMADVAFELARRGHAVRVYASARGYENPAAIYPSREILSGADVRRFPFASFGKKSILLRVAGTAAFHLQAFFAAMFAPRPAGIFFSTSPPLIGLPLCVAAALRRIPVVYWAMDLNPDQLIALGKIKPDHWIARVLEAANRFILRRCALVVALDRFMEQRLKGRGMSGDRILVNPPWSHEQHMGVEQGPNPFRERHGLADKFVVMYSGNHSPSNPLTTILEASLALKDDPRIRFLFIGGGSGKTEVERFIREHGLNHVLSLPYEPISELKHSLAAADVHLVSLGEGMVGIIHPCKVYGAMAVAKPVIFVGPRPSHISDLMDAHAFGEHIRHGDVAGAVAAINRFRSMAKETRDELGRVGQEILRDSLGQSRLCGRLCDAVEVALGLDRSFVNG